REEGVKDDIRLSSILDALETDYPEDWLLPLEIYELVSESQSTELLVRVKSRLAELAKNEKTGHLVSDGLRLVSYT
ncbi:MAG: phenylalanine 4-monooxygenase, partial [Lutimonas sp.]